MRISDWSSDVCSSDLVKALPPRNRRGRSAKQNAQTVLQPGYRQFDRRYGLRRGLIFRLSLGEVELRSIAGFGAPADKTERIAARAERSLEHIPAGVRRPKLNIGAGAGRPAREPDRWHVTA